MAKPFSSDATFAERYMRLNAAQREAVDTIEGPVMVIAGPGTGKTTILTLRIANILKRTDTPPSGILAITYTDAGVKAMRTKLREVIGGRADEVRIHTFHGFAASVIAEFRDHFPHLSRSEQITDIEAEAIVRDILADAALAELRPFGNPDMYIGPILGAIRDCKKEAWTPDTLRAFCAEEAKRTHSDPASISTRGASKGELKADAKKRIERLGRTALFADVYERYEAAKRGKKDGKRLIDFDDLIIELMLALERDELLLRLVQERFLYLLVDEHQDTNDAQNLLVRMIADFFESPNLFVVGDEKQAIYRFQGASVENFLKFQNIWKDMKVISLADNYRSHQDILDAGFALIENNYAEGEHAALRVELRAGGPEGRRPIDVVTAGNSDAEESWLAREISKIVSADSRATVAVIVRKNRLVERALAVLEARGIQAAAERGADIFSHPAGALFFDLIGFLNDLSHAERLARTLAAGLWGMPFGEAAETIGLIKAGRVIGIESRIPAIAELQRLRPKSSAMQYIVAAAEISGFTAAIADDPLAVEVWRGIVSLSEEIVRRSGADDAGKLMAELLSYAASAESRSIKISQGSPDARVTVMTAHGSKGLEFDYVFMPYATEDAWMAQRRGPSFILPRERGDEDDVRDARRLFYVALTRAKKHAAISSSLETPGGKEALSLRFIAELPSETISTIAVPPETGLDIGQDRALAATAHERMLADFARRSLAERGLSVTALNHFIACPSRYFYKSVLRLPEAPSASAEKGNAMHAALDMVWRLPASERNIGTIEAELKRVIHDYFKDKSLLPAFERSALVKRLIDDAPAVSRALVGHFSVDPSAEAASETWVEAVHTPADTAQGDIRIHGKLDAVIRSGSTVSIFDYKTREAMSENAIRGLTQDSTGDYLRQLVFYKILLSGDPRSKGKSIEPSLVFVSPDSKGRCPVVTLPISAVDENAVKGEIDRLIESVRSGNVVTETCDDPDCRECALRRFTSS